MGALLDALPQGGSAADVKAREAVLLTYLGQISWSWEEVTHTAGGHTLKFLVMRDGMKLEGIRLSMSATLSQQIADRIGAVLPTPRLSDLIYQYAPVKLAPITHSDWAANGTMANLANMKTQSALVDAAIGERQGLVADVGKDWTINNGLLKATNGCGPGWPALAVGQVASNYGWHVASGGDVAVTAGMRVIQGGTWGGRCHDRTHADYSQCSRLIQLACELDGVTADIRDVLTSPDPTINALVSHEGALLTTRQPGVEPPPANGGAVASGGSGPSTAVVVNQKPTGSQLVGAGMLAAAATVGSVVVKRLFDRFGWGAA